MSAAEPGSTASIRSGSILVPVSAVMSSSSRAGGLSLALLASTTSRAAAGTSRMPACSTSVTKNGLPPVSRYSSAGSRPLAAASRPTPGGDRGASVTRWIDRSPARSPSATRSGWSVVRPSSR